MTETANYKLKQPSAEDFYNIEDFNGNMDILDTQLKSQEEAIAQKAPLESGAVPIASGGTGAATAEQALTNLGAVPVGRTVNGRALTENITITKADVGLGNVDNTADSAKSVASAAILTTARTIRTNLASTTAASFNGSANITPGVTGTLAAANGGTGATSLTGITVGKANACNGLTFLIRSGSATTATNNKVQFVY